MSDFSGSNFEEHHHGRDLPPPISGADQAAPRAGRRWAARHAQLLRFKPDGGAEEYARYGDAATPFLAGARAKIRYIGDIAATVIGNDEWDRIVLVEYPNKQAFFDMTSNPDYPSEIRAGSLADSRLYCSQESSF